MNTPCPAAKQDAFWLSATDTALTPGQFEWTDGTAVDNITWSYTDPNDFGIGRKTCVAGSSNLAKLWDAKCSDYHYTLCEFPANLYLCL